MQREREYDDRLDYEEEEEEEDGFAFNLQILSRVSNELGKILRELRN